MGINANRNKGFSYIKLAIFLGLVAILFILMLPGRQDDSIRSKVEHGLSQVMPARAALANTCSRNENAVVSRNSQAGYSFIESMYLADVRVSAECSSGKMEIRVKTQNTGSAMDPVIVLFGSVVDSAENPALMFDGIEWSCALAKGNPAHVPDHCRQIVVQDGMPSFADT